MAALNDPAKSRSRAGLLRSLNSAGINSFNAYRIEEGREPERWPVFLRTEGSHSYPTSDLLHSTHPSPQREESYRVFKNSYQAALRALPRARFAQTRGRAV
jgi:hypothetical protein